MSGRTADVVIWRLLEATPQRVLPQEQDKRIEFYDQGGGILRVICLSQPVVVRSKGA